MNPLALADFQDGFARALLAPPPDAHPGEAAHTPLAAPAGLPPAIAALAQQPGFAVYRNTVLKGCIDALLANYPAVLRLVGEDWLRAAAAVHVRQALPADARLLHYGTEFPAFLRGFAPAAELPYLADVAWLDRCWTEAHVASDADPLDPAALAVPDPQTLGARVLRPHPAARWAWFDDQPIYTLWRRTREQQDEDADLPWHGEGALITRPGLAVQWQPLDAAGCAFLDSCAQGQTLTEAAGAALARQPDADLQSLMATLLGAGALRGAPH
jgi:hypothetical protein